MPLYSRPIAGEVPERLNGLVSKTSMELVFIGSSNLPLSASPKSTPSRWRGVSVFLGRGGVIRSGESRRGAVCLVEISR